MNDKNTKVLQKHLRSIKKHIPSLILASIIFIFLSGCITTHKSTKNIDTTIPPTPDYHNDSSWVFKAPTIDKPVDVFYVYPTIYTEDSPTNMDINNEDLRKKAHHLIYSQASVYAKSANIFAPYYRQMSLAMLNPNQDMYTKKEFLLGYSDVSKAFDYFLKNLNNGRPFILAGHSQGSMILISLMREHFKKQDLQNKLIAAYIIGYSITKDDFNNYPWLKPAQQANDTGVIISYNTQAPWASNSPVLLAEAFCINPLNWSTEDTPVSKSSNIGAVFFNANTNKIEREIPHYAGARIDSKTGALFTNLSEELDLGSFPPGVYHRYDYTIWYRNLEENVKDRCEKYLKQKP